MGKNLAIKGHSTRGDEVIELLKMLGGDCKNAYDYTGCLDCYYYITEFGRIESAYKLYEFDNFIVYTLDEFWKTFPFKVGDKVIDLKTNKIAEVYKMHWSENTNCVYYNIKYPNNCGCQRRLMDLKSMDDKKDVHSISECKTIGQGTYAIRIADGYKFDSVDENGNIIVKAFKPKPTYPANYDECKVVLQLQDSKIQARCGYEWRLISYFQQLLMCRDAYWKVAGEQMGLDGPWKPDWENYNEYKYCLYITENNVNKGIFYNDNHILTFPTEEMRDVFYENFKDLIEDCKELL